MFRGKFKTPLLPKWRWWPALPLAALVVLAIIGSCYEPQAAQHQNSTTLTDKGSAPKSPGGEPFWQRTFDDPVALFTFTLAVFTFVLAVSTIGLWIVTWLTLRHARSDAERQSSEMQASIAAAATANEIQQRGYVTEHRPWLEIDLLIDGGARFTDTVFEFNARILVKNLGNTPATNVFVSQRMFSAWGADLNVLPTKAAINTYLDGVAWINGVNISTILPKGVGSITIGASFLASDWILMQPFDALGPVLVIDVHYSSPIAGVTGQTAVRYDIAKGEVGAPIVITLADRYAAPSLRLFGNSKLIIRAS